MTIRESLVPISSPSFVSEADSDASFSSSFSPLRRLMMDDAPAAPAAPRVKRAAAPKKVAAYIDM